MLLNDYLTLIGLAEALVISLAFNVFVGLRWRSFRNARQRLDKVCGAMSGILRKEANSAPPNTGWLACLNALTVLLSGRRIDELETWSELLAGLRQGFDGETGDARHQPIAPKGQALPLPSLPVSGVPLETPASPMPEGGGLDRSGLRAKCEDIKRSYEKLAVHLGSVLKPKQMDRLHLVKEIEEDILDLDRILAVLAPNEAEPAKPRIEEMEEQIGAMRHTLAQYRTTVQKALAEKNQLVEDNRKLLADLKAKDKAYERLSRGHENSRREFEKPSALSSAALELAMPEDTA